jgi:hypothetical protein
MPLMTVTENPLLRTGGLLAGTASSYFRRRKAPGPATIARAISASSMYPRIGCFPPALTVRAK